MTVTASCHCGGTRLSFPRPTEAKSCNCSYCARTGAIWAYFEPDRVEVQADDDRVYAPRQVNMHHFCGTCGMQTHGYAPDWASIYNNDGTLKEGVEQAGVPTRQIAAVNLRMADGLDLSGIDLVEVDGRNNW